MVNRPYAIDIYSGDDVVDLPGKPLGGFVQVKAQGIAFLDHKATESTGYRDPRLASRYNAWMTGEPVRVTDVNGDILQITPKFGFYHFNGPGTNIAGEVANFISTVRPLFKPGDDLCYDWEGIGASQYEVSAVRADDWCSRVEDWCGFAIRVYGGNVPREQLAHAPSSVIDRFAKRRLWDCQYAPHITALPLPWQASGPFLWQDDGDKYGPGPHTIPGIHGYCDNSTVVGTMTVAKLAGLWGGGKSAG